MCLIFASSNIGFFKIMWSRCNGLIKSHYQLFNMPLRFDQQVSLMKGKTINVLFEELPLFCLQLYILFTNDVKSNSSDLDQNSHLAIMIALISTVLGLLMNATILCGTRKNAGESRMRKQTVYIKNPKRDLRLISNRIAKSFSI